MDQTLLSQPLRVQVQSECRTIFAVYARSIETLAIEADVKPQCL